MNYSFGQLTFALIIRLNAHNSYYLCRNENLGTYVTRFPDIRMSFTAMTIQQTGRGYPDTRSFLCTLPVYSLIESSSVVTIVNKNASKCYRQKIIRLIGTTNCAIEESNFMQ